MKQIFQKTYRYLILCSALLALSYSLKAAAPTLADIESSNISFTVGSPAVNVTNTITVTDIDGIFTFATAVVKISGGYVSSEDVLSLSGVSLSGSFNSSNGELTIYGTGGAITSADFEAALRAVKYNNTNVLSPSVSARTLSFTIYDGLQSNTLYRGLTITAVNNAPVLGGAGSSINYTESDSPKVIAGSITLSDDSPTLSSATITISNFVSGEDQLNVTVSSPLVFIYNASTGNLTISGAGTPAQYQAALRNVTYRNLNDSTPDVTSRTINFQAYDGEKYSNTVSQNINVIPVNDAPTAIADAYSGVNEGGTLTVTAGNGVLKNDRDPDGPVGLTAQKVTDPLYGTLTFNSNGSFTYVHNGSENLVDQFTYRAYDSQLQSSAVTVQITIIAQNDDPVLSGIEVSTLAFIEDETAKTVTSNIIVTDNDNTSLSSAFIQITGNYLSTEDSLYYTSIGGSVVYSKANGSITLTGSLTLADYQTFLRSIKYKNFNKANPSTSTRTVSFTVNDGTTGSNIATRQISITRTNDPPVATNAAANGTNYYVGDKLNTGYTFSDPDGDLEGTPTFRWYNATSSAGASMAAISGAVKDTFTIRNADGGKYVAVVVTPVDEKGLSGIADTSVFHYVNAAPVFTDSLVLNKIHPNSFAVGEIVTARFPYKDNEGNLPGTHQYQWYRSSSAQWSGATAISGATDTTYTIVNADKDKFIAMKARPLATSGSSPGRYFQSSWYSVSLLPSASLSGVDSICNDGTTKAILTVVLSSSNPPVSFTYKRNNGTTQSVNGIGSTNFNYQLEIPNSDTGTFKLLSVSDSKYSYGIRIDSIGKVVYYPKASAALTLDTLKICSGDLSIFTIPVTLQGKAPWGFTYKRDATTVIPAVSGVLVSPYNLPVSNTLTGKYTITTVTDGNACTAAGTGQTVVVIKTDPKATITGTDTICPYSSAPISIAFTGTAPWKISYTLNNGAETNVTTSANPYVMNKTTAGTYRVKKITDGTNKEGCSVGAAVISHFTLPTASISGTSNICEGTTANLNVTLTGTKPWKVLYNLDGVLQDSVKSIRLSPKGIPISKPGNYTLQSVADSNCIGTTSGTHSLSVTFAPKTKITISDSIFHITNSIPVPIYFTPKYGTYSADPNSTAIYKLNDTSFYFWPPFAGVGTTKVKYQYTDPSTTCTGKDSINLKVTDKLAEIYISDSHLDSLERLCSNFDSVLIVGYAFDYHEPGTFTISGTNPSEKALRDLRNNTAYLYPKYIKSGPRTVTYNYRIGTGDQKTQKTFYFENVVADFNWDNDCYVNGNTVVKLTGNSSSEDTIIHHYWKIDFPNTVEEYDSSEVTVNFDALQSYPIRYVAVSNFGCTDTIDDKDKLLVLNKTYNPKSTAYFEDFSDGASGWSAGTLVDTVNTWTLGRPTGRVFNAPEGTMAWYTQIPDKQHSKEEHSYVVSPCFNFENSARPMIKMKIWKAFYTSDNLDGAVLEYWTPKSNWTTLGKVDDALNWYNNSSEIEGEPGVGKIGWTHYGSSSADKDWVIAKHTLDDLAGEAKVKFRIAYGAKKYSIDRDGFAFDDIWIGERSKKILFEHFTNNGCEDCVEPNNSFNFLVNKNAIDVIDLQYHMDAPGVDTFYNLNIYPPFARVNYYNVSNAPYSIMDGGGLNKTFDYLDLSNYPKQKDLDEAILEDNTFSIKIVGDIQGDVMPISIDVIALKAFGKRPLTLHIAVIEHEIKGIVAENGETIFESVVRSMVPSTAGTSINRSWDIGSSEHIEEEWEIKNVFDRDELRVVAFLQDETTQEIYQAAIDNPFIKDGLNPNLEDKIQNLIVYPNPTYGATTLFWKKPVEGIQTIAVFDNLGRVVRKFSIFTGEQYKTINLQGLEAGTYNIRVTSGKYMVDIQRIILLSNQ